MWWILLSIFLQGMSSVQSLDMDGSVRSRLGHFNTTRNNLVSPEDKAKARDYIMKTFQEFGLDTWTEEFPSNQNSYPGINVIGRVKGRYTGTNRDKIVIIGSHYDTVQTTNGVDDNGSGVTALLQTLAKYKSTNNAKCTQDYTLLFVAFDLEENQGGSCSGQCACRGIVCGSNFFVKNLTRHLNNTGIAMQGAFILETILNFDTTPKSQNLPFGSNIVIPTEYAIIEKNEFRGDFLAVIGRRDDDKELMTSLTGNYPQGRFKALKVPLPFSGKTTDLPPIQQGAYSHFLRSDHANFWNGAISWPAVFVTDTADFRGFMKTCYHQSCDNLNSVTPDMISFLGKTVEALVSAASKMTGRDCPGNVTYCANEKAITSNKETISSPLYPSQYPNGVSCGWVRESEYPQKLVFENFDLENSVNCSLGDYVEVIAGEKSLGRFCGSKLPQAITRSEKKLRVRFVSDAFVTGKGFTITWSTIAPTSLAVQLHGFQPMAMAFAVIASFILKMI